MNTSDEPAQSELSGETEVPSTQPGRTIPARRRIGIHQRISMFPATYGIIGVTALVFLAQLLSIQIAGFDLVVGLGAKVNHAIASGQIWRLITPLFIHAGTWHLFVNMYSLSILGPAVERFFGSPRFLVVYLLSGIGGVDLSLAFSPLPSVGASGAIFGLLGALGVLLFLHRKTFGRAGAIQLRQIVIVALLNLGLGLMPGIDNWGHLGGLITGASLAWFLGPRFEPLLIDPNRIHLVDRRAWSQVRTAVIVSAGIIALVSFAATLSPFSA